MIRIFFAYIILLFLPGCGKSAMSKLAGIWDVEILIIAGIDSTASVKNQTCYQPMVFISEDDDLSGGVTTISHPYYGCGPEGNYWLSDGDKYLKIAFHEGTGFNAVGPFGLWANTPKWKIIILTYEALWLEVNYKNMPCTLYLKKTLK